MRERDSFASANTEPKDERAPTFDEILDREYFFRPIVWLTLAEIEQLYGKGTADG